MKIKEVEKQGESDNITEACVLRERERVRGNVYFRHDVVWCYWSVPGGAGLQLVAFNAMENVPGRHGKQFEFAAYIPGPHAELRRKPDLLVGCNRPKLESFADTVRHDSSEFSGRRGNFKNK